MNGIVTSTIVRISSASFSEQRWIRDLKKALEFEVIRILQRAHLTRWQIGLVCGVISSVCYGVMLFLVHAVADRIPPQEVAALRALCTVAILLPTIARHGLHLFGEKASFLWVRSLIAAISVFCFTWNLQHTTVGFANTLFNFAPLLIVILGIFSHKERLQWSRVSAIALVVLASVLFWHGSRTETNWTIWVVGLGGMCAASLAYFMLKALPASWTALDRSWCSSIAIFPVVMCFKGNPWINPVVPVRWELIVVCILGLAADAFENLAFQNLDLSTATALIPSAIIWGVLLDMKHHNFPPLQGFGGCLLYLLAVLSLILSRPVDHASMGTSDEYINGVDTSPIASIQYSNCAEGEN